MTRLIPLLSILIALLFLAGGTAKIFRLEFERAVFERFDLPLYAMTLAGIAEWAAAVLLLRRSTATLGAIMGVGIMVIAVAAHLHSGEHLEVVLPLFVGGALICVGWQRRGDLARWLRPSPSKT